jgi:hypothetical protein
VSLAGRARLTIEFRAGDTEDSSVFKMTYEDIEGRAGSLMVNIVYDCQLV